MRQEVLRGGADQRGDSLQALLVYAVMKSNTLTADGEKPTLVATLATHDSWKSESAQGDAAAGIGRGGGGMRGGRGRGMRRR
ncbi:hypothetical protein Tco_0149056 [Tanacetum coccineum]